MLTLALKSRTAAISLEANLGGDKGARFRTLETMETRPDHMVEGFGRSGPPEGLLGLPCTPKINA